MKERVKRLFAVLCAMIVTGLCTVQSAVAAITVPETVDITSVETMATGIVGALIGILAIAFVYKMVKKAA